MKIFGRKKNKWRATLSLALIVAVLLTTLSAATYVVIQDYKDQALSLIKEAKEHEIDKHRQLIKDRVGIAMDLIDIASKNAENILRQRIKEKVDDAYKLVQSLYTEMKDEYSEKVIRKSALELLRNIRWDNGAGYFFINSTDGEIILFPLLPELEGTNPLNEANSRHKSTAQLIFQKGKLPGGGFIEYMAPKLQDAPHLYRKLSYLRTFKPFGWIIGSGGYPEDTEIAVKKQMLQKLSKLNNNNDRDNHLFIIDLDKANDKRYGQLLLTRNTVIPAGNDIPRNFTDGKGFHLFDKAINQATLKGETYVKYFLQKPSTGVNEDKISYFKHFKKWNWLLGSGFYLGSIKSAYAAKILKIKQQTEHKITYALIGLALVIVTALAVIIAVAIYFDNNLKDRQRLMQQLLDSQTNLVFLTNGMDMIACNKQLLRTVGCASLAEFRKSHDCICEHFLQIEGYLSNVKGQWIDDVIRAETEGRTAKALIYDHSTGSRRIFMVNIGEEILEDSYGTVSLTDITDYENVKSKLHRYVRIVDEYVQTSSTDLAGKITSVSNALEKATGYSEQELMGNTHRILRHPDMPDEVFADMWKTIKSGRIWRGELKNKCKNGREFWTQAYISPVYDEIGRAVGYTAIRHDITDKKKIEKLTITDVMTGLSNRRHFNDVFTREINHAKRNEQSVVFFMIDVDKFKQYNDTYGHQAGDEALKTVSETMIDLFKRAHEYTFRLGGEEFGVILCDISIDEAQRAAETLRKRVQERKVIHAKNRPEGVLTVSIGVCVANVSRTTSIDEIMLAADNALYEGKNNGRNQVVVKTL